MASMSNCSPLFPTWMRCDSNFFIFPTFDVTGPSFPEYVTWNNELRLQSALSLPSCMSCGQFPEVPSPSYPHSGCASQRYACLCPLFYFSLYWGHSRPAILCLFRGITSVTIRKMTAGNSASTSYPRLEVSFRVVSLPLRPPPSQCWVFRQVLQIDPWLKYHPHPAVANEAVEESYTDIIGI